MDKGLLCINCVIMLIKENICAEIFQFVALKICGVMM